MKPDSDISHADITVLTTPRLRLTPLGATDAVAMVEVLSDPMLYEFTGGVPPTRDELAARYRAQIAGSPDPKECWLNWILRLPAGEPIGFVQATVRTGVAEVAWVVGVPWQRNGYGSEAAKEMCAWLESRGGPTIVAHIHPDHVASKGVAQAIGMHWNGTADEDGEQIWSTEAAAADPPAEDR